MSPRIYRLCNRNYVTLNRGPDWSIAEKLIKIKYLINYKGLN